MESDQKIEIRCPFCQALFQRRKTKQDRFPIQFCAYCGTRFSPQSTLDKEKSLIEATYISEHTQEIDEKPITRVGRYLLIKSIGKGGMGEVFLAYDSVCGRRIALKRIRPDLVSSSILRERFIREARITSQLIHPAIIPIYDIHIDQDVIYYTMPYMEGETLKNLLQRVRDQQVSFSSSALGDQHTTIASLVRIFLGIAQAVAFAHSRGVLHRDIKPENVIIGRYGQVIILDWGLTKLIEDSALDSECDDNDPTSSKKSPNTKKKSRSKEVTINTHLTRIGKVVGTLAYMAPERAQGKPASTQTEIYSLGVILYQMLTLTLPFSRKSVKEFQASWQDEKYTPPEIRAPHRDVPQSLSEIVRKCLCKDPSDRWATVDELLKHIEGYLEGRSEWTQVTHLDIQRKSDWAFQEHVLLTEHAAISTSVDQADWCRIMLSQDGHSENVQISTRVLLKKGQNGIGFLLAVPEETARRHILDGYCVWLASSTTSEASPSKILRHGVVAVELPDVSISEDSLHEIRIEKIDHSISVHIDGVCVATHTSFFPTVGRYIGLLLKDADLRIEDISLASGSINILVNRLAVPDAFLAHHEFDRALSEYRRIATLFPGHFEGREALFRAGLCLLEKAKYLDSKKRLHAPGLLSHETNPYYDEALAEFEKLRKTPGAPLEYLGKALVYHDLQEYSEEVKCFELAFLRYKHHPLLKLLSELALQRMHEMSRLNRINAYEFISLVARRLPSEIIQKPSTQKLFTTLQRSWEVPHHFIADSTISNDKQLSHITFCLTLAFWLLREHVAIDIFTTLCQRPILPKQLIFNALSILSTARAYKELLEHLSSWKALLSSDEQEEFSDIFQLFYCITGKESSSTIYEIAHTWRYSPQFICHFCDQMNSQERFDETCELFLLSQSKNIYFPEEAYEYVIEAALMRCDLKLAETILDLASIHISNPPSESNRLFFWYGIYLLSKGNGNSALHHFQSVLDTPTPRTWLLGAHVITRKIRLSLTKGWLTRSFPYERSILFRHLNALGLYKDALELASSSYLDESIIALSNVIPSEALSISNDHVNEQ